MNIKEIANLICEEVTVEKQGPATITLKPATQTTGIDKRIAKLKERIILFKEAGLAQSMITAQEGTLAAIIAARDAEGQANRTINVDAWAFMNDNVLIAGVGSGEHSHKTRKSWVTSVLGFKELIKIPTTWEIYHRYRELHDIFKKWRISIKTGSVDAAELPIDLFNVDRFGSTARGNARPSYVRNVEFGQYIETEFPEHYDLIEKESEYDKLPPYTLIFRYKDIYYMGRDNILEIN
jgi:hypothetical protein